MRKTLARHGLPGPRFKKVDNLKDFRDGLKEIGFPAVLKPLSGAGAKSVIKLDAAKQKELENTSSIQIEKWSVGKPPH
jgi:biotin carboxylase